MQTARRMTKLTDHSVY